MKKTADVYRQRSKDRLTKIATGKIRTTMIGALDSIEKKFGHLWGHDQLDLTPEQEANRELFDALRSEILDKGNNQVRNMEAEMAQYEIDWKRYQYEIPIERSLGGNDE